MVSEPQGSELTLEAIERLQGFMQRSSAEGWYVPYVPKDDLTLALDAGREAIAGRAVLAAAREFAHQTAIYEEVTQPRSRRPRDEKNAAWVAWQNAIGALHAAALSATADATAPTGTDATQRAPKETT